MPRKQRMRRMRGRSFRAIAPSTMSVKPPQLAVSVPYRHTYRFVATASFAGGITASGILGAAGVFAKATNSSVAALYNSFKINRVRVWALQAGSATTTATLAWTDPAGGSTVQSNLEISDTSINPSFPAFLDVKPPSESLAGFWNSESASDIFTLNVNSEFILDLDISLRTFEVGPQFTVTTAALGNLYWLALDGPSSNLIIPVGLATTH